MSYKSPSHQAEEKIMLARDEKDRLYEPKPNKKAIRILTVAAYVLCVSSSAIMLSLYYIFFWDPIPKTVSVKPTTPCQINLTQVTERDFRQMTGVEKNAEVVHIVSPSIGPSIPTAVLSPDRVYDVKEIEIVKKLPSELNVANLVLGGGGNGGSSSTGSPLTAAVTTIGNEGEDQETDDTEYQDDDMEFEIEESSGNGVGLGLVREYKTQAPVNIDNSSEGGGGSDRKYPQFLMRNENDI